MEEVGHVEGEPRADDDLFLCLYLQLLFANGLFQFVAGVSVKFFLGVVAVFVVVAGWQWLYMLVTLERCMHSSR